MESLGDIASLDPLVELTVALDPQLKKRKLCNTVEIQFMQPVSKVLYIYIYIYIYIDR